MPTQIEGAKFLASRKYALLADEPRVGKTGAAIIGADLCIAGRVLVITTKSGRPVWRRGFDDWQAFGRTVHIPKNEAGVDKADVIIVSWAGLLNKKLLAALLSVKWDLIISDEDHYAKNFDSKRTQALYGRLDRDGALLMNQTALYARSERVWPLTGTPYPHDLSDGYTRLRALAPELLRGNPERGWPDVTRFGDFRHRYCIVRMKPINPFRSIPVVIGGRNEAEFYARFNAFGLRRTQKDVGIQPPRYDFQPLALSRAAVREIEAFPEAARFLAAFQRKLAGKQSKEDDAYLDMHLGPLLRLTGNLKAQAVIEAVKEDFESGLDRIVLAYWHREVGDILHDGLADLGVLRIDGKSTDRDRSTAEESFRLPKGPKVFLAQIAAAGEAIDLSASAELWFVEQVISPKGMSQMSKRITNKTQTRTPIVKVCTLAGSIDEAIQESLMRLWTSINKGTEA